MAAGVRALGVDRAGDELDERFKQRFLRMDQFARSSDAAANPRTLR
jgi:hypothetical protein